MSKTIYIPFETPQTRLCTKTDFDPETGEIIKTEIEWTAYGIEFKDLEHYEQHLAAEARRVAAQHALSQARADKAIAKIRRVAESAIFPLSLIAFSLLALGGTAEGIRLFSQFLDTGVLP